MAGGGPGQVRQGPVSKPDRSKLRVSGCPQLDWIELQDELDGGLHLEFLGTRILGGLILEGNFEFLDFWFFILG